MQLWCGWHFAIGKVTPNFFRAPRQHLPLGWRLDRSLGPIGNLPSVDGLILDFVLDEFWQIAIDQLSVFFLGPVLDQGALGQVFVFELIPILESQSFSWDEIECDLLPVSAIERLDIFLIPGLDSSQNW